MTDRMVLSSSSFYDCTICGRYLISDSVKYEVENKYARKRHLLAGYLINTKDCRDYNSKLSEQDDLKNVTISSERLKNMLNYSKIPKTAMQKLDNLLLFVYRFNKYIGQKLMFQVGWYPTCDSDIHPYALYSVNEYEVVAMFDELDKMQYINNKAIGETNVQVKLRPLGFERAEQLCSTNIDSKKVFVAMGFKKDLLDAMENAIIPACKDCGFDAYLIKDKEHNNVIMDEIIIAIKTSKFVITDFTYNNPGAYFEAGYAQGYGLDVIRCCKKEWFDEIAKDKDGNELVDKDRNKKKANQLHFDVSHYNFIMWENEADLKERLKHRIRSLIQGANMTDDKVGD